MSIVTMLFINDNSHKSHDRIEIIRKDVDNTGQKPSPIKHTKEQTMCVMQYTIYRLHVFKNITQYASHLSREASFVRKFATRMTLIAITDECIPHFPSAAIQL